MSHTTARTARAGRAVISRAVRRFAVRPSGARWVAALTASATLVTACSGYEELPADPAAELSAGAAVSLPDSAVVFDSTDPVTLAIDASTALFVEAGIVVLVDEGGDQLRAASIAMVLGVPALVTSESRSAQVAAELERLGTHTVLVLEEAVVPELSEGTQLLRAVAAPQNVAGLQVVLGQELSGSLQVDPANALTMLASAQQPYEWIYETDPEAVPVEESEAEEPGDDAPSDPEDVTDQGEASGGASALDPGSRAAGSVLAAGSGNDTGTDTDSDADTGTDTDSDADTEDPSPSATEPADPASQDSTAEPSDGGIETPSPSESATEDLTTLPGLPPVLATERTEELIVVSDGGPGQVAALGTARAAGADAVIVPGGDISMDPLAIATIYGNDPTLAMGLGEGLPDAGTLAYQVAVATTGDALPGGGQWVLPAKTYVGLRGTPGAPELGPLGEGTAQEGITAVREYAAGVPGAIPTAELLTTIASDTPGSDGTYSRLRSGEDLIETLDLAAQEGVMTLLSFQPGRARFIQQLEQYPESLARPAVGVVLDATWRLSDTGTPTRPGGPPTDLAEELTETLEWLAEQVLQESLPPKLVVLRLPTGFDVESLEIPTAAQVSVVLEVDGAAVLPAPTEEPAPQPSATGTDEVAEDEVTLAEAWDSAVDPAYPYWGWLQGPDPVELDGLLALDPAPVLIVQN
ncbi:hypothetical protein [Serinibacter salmoneus]|uniref:Uncharacterized protein n=1 Tax=Serinibacter salmoneus TaxID=556530 RepID=A0A2A9D0Y7_9MICO|nr:hypothetical protein [Serinibacter salmoneus]PFG20051.1 hypothetical protein ATL40_1634 [Serinibacter salmoneus]